MFPRTLAFLLGLVFPLVALQSQPKPIPNVPQVEKSAQERADSKTSQRDKRASGIKVGNAANPITEAQNVIDLRAAMAAGGRVRVAPGRYILASPLVLTRTTSLIGDYRDLCVIDGSQMTDPTQPILMIDRVWGYEISNITITGNRSLNSIGILNSTNTPNANGSYGTCSGSSIISHIIVSGCKKGIVIGNRDLYIASSELIADHVEVIQCNRCIELNDFNTLNIVFRMLLMGDCFEGLVTNGASYITIVGGSISSCYGVCFDFSNCSSAFLKAVRMEESCMFCRCGTTSTASQFTIENCLLHQRASAGTDNTSAYVNGWKNLVAVGGSAMLTMRNNFLTPTVNVSPILDVHNVPGGMIEAIGNTCTIDPAVTPLISANSSTTEKIYTRSNAQVLPGNVFVKWYPDQSK